MDIKDLDIASLHPVPDAHGINLYEADASRDVLSAYLPEALYQHLQPHLSHLGQMAGGYLDDLASVADKNPPTLSIRTRAGIDENRINKHPDYVELERWAYSKLGLAAMSHRGGVLGWPEPMPPAAKYALTYLFVQAEFGLCCPVSMTDSLARTLRKFGDPALVEKVLPMVTTQDFDELHQGAMFMTEQGAGSDVSATDTTAQLHPDGHWILHGDKWFCSNPDAGFAMVLARSEETPGLKGISLFLLPRTLDDGSHNHYRILRLKDKLGTRSMASGEIRLEGAQAWLVGERGQGFKHMSDMINNSRLSNGVRAAGLMRRALTEALYVSKNRLAFNRRLIDLPLMQRQLLKLAVWTEQARTMVFQTARALEAFDRDEAGRPLARIMTPLIKFRACRDARKVTGDAMEVRGGCGYIEEWSDPRILRDAHLGSIWEGTSNIVALDVIRAIRREKSLPALRQLVDDLLREGTPVRAELAELQQSRIDAAFAVAEKAGEENDDIMARQVGTALYNVVTMAGMRWEAAKTQSEMRTRLADYVLLHRLSARDPLTAQDQADAELLNWLAQGV
ncbi:acyl-CoA dehydrogenase family protein [Orrella sp. 11846]|uniref:acyl-CoA dehydrogenase family protein n=1 Tax=Orrella sp. 11846 TaxID=3409913 RepID=UPI003B5AF3A8